MGPKSFFSARGKETSEVTAVADLEKQEIVEESTKTMEKSDKDDNGTTNEHEHVIVMLKKLESSLDKYLGNHIQEIKTLHETTLAPIEPVQKTKHGSNVTVLGRDENSKRRGSKHAAASHIHTHVKYIDEFLNAYVENVRVLQQKLQEKFPNGQEKIADDVDIREKTYKSMMEQFNMQLIVSTFTAGLILAWCSLVKALQIDGAHAELLYNVGLLLSLVAIALHFFNILLSGRCVALCSDHTLLKNHTISYFFNALETCEQLYLHGMLIFGIAVLEMTFIMFSKVVYPAVFCGVVAFGLVILAAGKFRKMSVMYQNMVKIKALAWTLGGKVGGKW